MIKFKIPLPNKFIFQTTISVRVYDLNYGNHVGHDSVLSIFHEARVSFLHENKMSEIDIFGLGWIISFVAVEYKSQSKYGDIFDISIGIGDVSLTSIDLIYIGKNEITGKEIARAITRMTFFDYGSNRVAKIPNQFLKFIGME